MSGIRIAFILPGLGRVQRGAETAFIELARALTKYPDVEVELFGSGAQGLGDLPVQVIPCSPRERFERWPSLPCLRNETQYEECSFVLQLAWGGQYRPAHFDAAITCSYPFVNWFLQRAHRKGGPVHVHVTQNGDWPCRRVNREFRYFACDGLVCTNPAYFEQHQQQYASALIPNGVDPAVFRPLAVGEQPVEVAAPAGQPVVLIASALIPSKRVAHGVQAVARSSETFLLVVGDGPERGTLTALCRDLLPGRHQLLGSVPREQMPALYRRADAFLHLSQDEPFGIVYLEAASSGLPVVAHDGPVPRWILGDAALYANTSDPEAVASALQRALSPGTRQQLGQSGRLRVLRDWTWEQQAARYRDFILDLLARRRGGRRSFHPSSSPLVPQRI